MINNVATAYVKLKESGETEPMEFVTDGTKLILILVPNPWTNDPIAIEMDMETFDRMVQTVRAANAGWDRSKW